MARLKVKDKLDFWIYRLKVMGRSFKVLYTLPPEKLNAFIDAYAIYDYDWEDQATMMQAFGPNYLEVIKQKLIDWYVVINHLCALGQVEKMYIPPAIDLSKSIIANQILFEKKLGHDLGLKKGGKALDIGCGRGRIASHIATSTGAHVTGVNIDADQLESAEKFVRGNGLTDRVRFQNWDLNQIPFPFEDGAFDAVYEVQVFSLSKNREKLFREIHRMLKPGGKFACLEWVLLDKYDPQNSHHANLMKQIKPLIGAIGNPTPQQFAKELESAGFKVTTMKNASIDGLQAPLIEKADKFYSRCAKTLNFLVKAKILPAHFNTLFERLSQGGHAFTEADRLRLVSTSHYIVAQKPK